MIYKYAEIQFKSVRNKTLKFQILLNVADHSYSSASV